MENQSQGKTPIWLILVVSVAVPALVAFLFFFPGKLELGNFVYALPHFHGVINSLTSLVLILALVAIKTGKMDLHKNLMTSGVVMGGIFLLSYVVYHSSVDTVIFGDANHDGELSLEEGSMVQNRFTYLILLISHILLSMVALPFVLIAFYHAVKKNFAKHKKVVKLAYPIWLYVSITGVIVYWMMRPYYF